MIRKRLLPPTIGLLVLIASHDFDHVRQGRHLAFEVTSVGIVGLVGALLLLVLVLRGMRFAAPFAMLNGFGNAFGLVAVHWLPRWSAFSDPYGAAHVDGVSWADLVVFIAVGLWLGFAGLAAMREGEPAAAHV